MPEGSKREREERAMDALLVSLLRRVDKEDDYIDPKYLPELTEEERATAQALGTDFVTKLFAGERPVAAKAVPGDDVPSRRDFAVSGCGPDISFNRADVVDDSTTQELEQREREIMERRRKEREGRNGEAES